MQEYRQKNKPDMIEDRQRKMGSLRGRQTDTETDSQRERVKKRVSETNVQSEQALSVIGSSC